MSHSSKPTTTDAARTLMVSTESLRAYLFVVTQYCRSVSDLTNEDKLPPTAFHSFEEPVFTLADYIIGIGRRLRLSRLTVLLSCVYLARLSQRTGRAPSILSVHRLFAATMLFAAKVKRDPLPSDNAFATSAGLPAGEVADLLRVVQVHVGHDADTYEADLDQMHSLLEVARTKQLRSEITVAVAKAFGLPVPRITAHPSTRDQVIPLPVITLHLLPSLASPRSPNTTTVDLWGSSIFTSHGSERGDTMRSPALPRSHESSYMVGSGMSAIRGLRSEASSPQEGSLMSLRGTVPQALDRINSASVLAPVPPPAPPSYGMATFVPRFMATLEDELDQAPSLPPPLYPVPPASTRPAFLTARPQQQ